MKTTHELYKYALALLLAMMGGVNVWGQNYRNVHVGHKAGMWYDDNYQRTYTRIDSDDVPDTFDEANRMIEHNGHSYQNTHTYEVDIYVNSNTRVNLSLPSQQNNNGDNNSLEYYQRWYNYDTDDDITYGSITPINDAGTVVSNRGVQFANGLLGGTYFNRTPLWRVRYNVPTDFSGITIACDASRYRDLINNRYRFTEPTLSNRNIFRIRPASEIKEAIQTATEAGRYYEEYEIHLPATRISSKAEVAALRMAARNYFKPGDNETNAPALICEADDVQLSDFNGNPNTGIYSISGDDRVIFYTYSNKGDGDVAYIYVKNGNYNVAKYTLIFEDNTHGLTQSAVEAIEREGSENPLYYRTNDFLENNYINLSTMDFDYTTTTSGLQDKRYYPYPIDWTYSSYGFYANDDLVQGYGNVPEWGEYAITNYFYSSAGGGTELPGSDYHLFVDASDKPGTIVKVPVRGNQLCAGAMLYVTAWVKNQAWGANYSEASLVFVLIGVKDGVETEIYRHATGQVPKTNGNVGDWHQIYFTYPNGNEVYDTYLLQLDNNCANSTGGDMCIDDIRIYMNPLHVEGQTVTPICKDDVTATIQLRLDYELMIGRVGLEDVTNSAITPQATTAHYCFLDKAIYDETFTGSNYQDAFEAALIEGEGIYPEEGSTAQYGIFTFYNDKNSNTGGDGVAGMEGDVLTFTSHVGAGATSVDPNDETGYLHSGRSYYILYNASSFDPNGNLWEQFNKEDICTVQGEFTVEGRLVIRGDGTADIDASTPCIGEIPIISAAMRNEDGNILDDVNFDWYFGTEEEFYAETVENHPERTLDDVLEAFRYFYPAAHSITTTIIEEVGDGRTEENHTLYKEDLDLLARLNSDYSIGGEQPKLALTASKDLNIHLMQAETPVVVIPIAQVDIEESEMTCWEPQGIVLRARGNAPTLKAGIHSSANGYPENYFVSVRLGLSHIRTLQSGSSLSIPLREPKDGEGNPTRLSLIDKDAVLYLGGTTDSEYADKVEDGLSYEIGTITSFLANSNVERNYVVIQLSTDNGTSGLNIKEGHSYTLNFRFQLTGATSEGSCNIGNLTIPLLIVPEFQTWVGGANGNWNNDGNWRRSTASELNKGTSYPTVPDAQGFVPLGFCKLTIPEGAQVQVYSPNRNTYGFLDLTTNRPANMGDATSQIEYDLAVANADDATLTCYRYYTNVCSELHFEPDAEMLHAERLNRYNKAWVDYRLSKGRWYTLASPLKEVVAGDFYTDSNTGTEEQEYFTDVTFGTNSYHNGDITNNRFAPSVYQRGWKGETSLITTGNGEEDGDSREVAVNGNWSSLYNDVTEKYEPGSGFSLKVQDINDNSAVFRLPKSDNSYTYYTCNNGNPTKGESVGIDRGTNAGKLKSDDLRNPNSSFAVSLGEAHDGTYYLIGNPFMAHLNMKEFFDQNNVFDDTYWLVTEGNQSVTVGTSGEGMISTTGNSTVAPLQSFFVKLEENQTAPTNITFTQDMQVLGGTSDGLRSSTDVLYLSATTSDGRTSRAAVAYDGAASAEYVSGEDAELFLDSNLGDVPMVYTVAGTMATSINRTSQLADIPVGLYGNAGETATLAFEGLDSFSGATLYDAQEGTETLLYDGRTVTVPARTSGRYFLRLGAATDNKTISARKAILIYTVGRNRVVVSSDGEPLQTIRVYNMAGSLVRQERVSGTQYEFTLPAGIYIVSAEDRNGMLENVKVRVR